MRKLSMAELNRKSITECKEAPKHPIVIILENIRSGYNVGSCFRTADAFLIKAIYIVGYTPCPPHKEIKKTALGAEESVYWKQFTSTEEAVISLRKEGYKIFAIEQVENSKKLNEISFDKKQKTAFIFGNEVSGVKESSISLADNCIEIPQWGMKHSFNIATAFGIVLWEIVR